MDDRDRIAARALLDQLTQGPRAPGPRPAAVAVPVRPEAAISPGPHDFDEDEEALLDGASPAEQRIFCEQCGARLTDAVGWCPRCLKPLPTAQTGARTVDHEGWERVRPPRFTTPPSPPARPGQVETASAGAPSVAASTSPGSAGSAGSAVGLAIAVIVINIVVQAATYGLVRSSHMQPNTAISISLWVSFGFYALIAFVAVRNRAATQVLTAWTVGDARVSIRRGLLIGGGASALVLGLQSLALHHLVGDPNVQLVVSDGSIGRILAAVTIFVLVGPVVEEFVFRGVLAEALRPRGTGVAMAVSAFLFALAHLRPANLVYYTLIGLLLGRLYFRYGLKASIAAHAIFNGILVGVAILSVVGPARTYHLDGAVVRLPAAWRTVPTSTPSPSQLLLEGPSASTLAILDRPVPAGAVFNPDAVRIAIQDNRIPLAPGSTFNSVQKVTYPAGAAVLTEITVDGHPGEVAVMVEDNREWIFALSTAGSTRAVSDFSHMMEHLTLP